MLETATTWLAENPLIAQLGELAALLLASLVLYWVVRRVLVASIRSYARVTETAWDDALIEAQVFVRLAHVPPALLVYYGVEFMPELGATLQLLLQRIVFSILIVVVARAISAFLNAANAIYVANPENRARPIKGYLQVAKLIVALLAALLVVATLMDRSPLLFLSGIGAMTAVLLLIFRDTILSLVASVQLSGNEMIHVGDWIEMPKYGADGDVIDVALHTVKVQNWDKTITTIPTHALIADSFKNWRGMSNSGGRRIKRAIFLDVSTIRFLDEDEIERFADFALLRDYIAAKRSELESFNAQGGRNPELDPDIRRLTNVGTLRAYILRYLRAHPKIHQEMTLLVRQLQPTAEGLPIEIYCFTNDTDWLVYEDVQADLFDHIYAILPEFGLLAYQRPSGSDLAEWVVSAEDAGDEA